VKLAVYPILQAEVSKVDYSLKDMSSNVRVGGWTVKTAGARHVGAMHGGNLRKFTETHARRPRAHYVFDFLLVKSTVVHVAELSTKFRPDIGSGAWSGQGT
jgi:hypothetical protein